MVKVEYFDVQFDAGQNLSFAGQRLTGVVVASTQQPLKVRCIEIRLLGEARTSWINKTSDKIYESSDTYVNEATMSPYLQEISDGELMPAGLHTLPFSFQLPDRLPSTYEGDCGYVRYKVVATVTLSPDNACILPSLQSAPELACERTFALLSLVDVKHVAKFPDNRVSQEEIFEVVGCLPCWSRGFIQASMTLSRRAFVVGRPIDVEVKLHNKSSSKRGGLLQLVQQAYLQSQSRYESACDSRTLSRVIEQIQVEPVEPDQRHPVVSKLTMDIPRDLTPTTIEAELLINVAYKLRLDLGGTSEICIPIFIATIDSGKQ